MKSHSIFTFLHQIARRSSVFLLCFDTFIFLLFITGSLQDFKDTNLVSLLDVLRVSGALTIVSGVYSLVLLVSTERERRRIGRTVFYWFLSFFIIAAGLFFQFGTRLLQVLL